MESASSVISKLRKKMRGVIHMMRRRMRISACCTDTFSLDRSSASPLDSSMERKRRDWASLPKDLLGLITEQLTVLDYIPFVAVCTSWASALQDGVYLPQAPKMPLLLEADVYTHTYPANTRSCVLYSPHDGRSYPLGPLPMTRLVGSQDGWLAVMGEHSHMGLLNPLTREQIRLPDASPPTDAYTNIYYKVVLSAGLSADSYSAVAISCSFRRNLVYTKSGEAKWHALDTGEDHIFSDVVYSGDGVFHAVAPLTGTLWAVDLTGASPKTTAVTVLHWTEIPLDHGSMRLVMMSGSLLLITMEGDIREVNIWKLDGSWARRWVPLESLGDSSLFLGSLHSVSVSAPKLPGVKPNSIYFSNVISFQDGFFFDSHAYGSHMAVVDFGERTAEFHHSPDPHHTRSIWITPNLS